MSGHKIVPILPPYFKMCVPFLLKLRNEASGGNVGIFLCFSEKVGNAKNKQKECHRNQRNCHGKFLSPSLWERGWQRSFLKNLNRVSPGFSQI